MRLLGKDKNINGLKSYGENLSSLCLPRNLPISSRLSNFSVYNCLLYFLLIVFIFLSFGSLDMLSHCLLAFIALRSQL